MLFAAGVAAARQAECLQSWCDLQRELLQQAPDDVLAQQDHTQQVTQAVVEAYRASLDAYKQVRSEHNIGAMPTWSTRTESEQ